MTKIRLILIGCFAFSLTYSQSNVLREVQTKNKLNPVTVLGRKSSENKTAKDLILNVKLVRVKGGEFIMGDTNPRSLTPYYSDVPKHKVSISDFYMAETEVSQALWKTIMNNNPSPIKGDSLPVCHLSWNDCQEFILKLNQRTGKKYRLPTEAEWEYVAGGGVQNGTIFSGTNSPTDLGNYAWIYENSNAKPHPVGTKKPNALGLYDMTGNVWEWCNDYLGTYPSTPQVDPQGPSSSSRRVIRGGSWMNKAKGLNLTLRNGFAPECSNTLFGCRLAMDIK